MISAMNFTQNTLIIGRITSKGIDMLGTGFLVSNSGKIATARHVVGNITEGLCILMPHISDINAYQDVADHRCQPIQAVIEDINPVTDICLLQGVGLSFEGILPKLDSLDNVRVGEKIGMFGFPHCVMGRRVLTYREAEIGAKMLLETSGVKSKYATLNMQTRPGQSGSLVLSLRTGNIVGMLIGTYAPSCGVIIAGINPHELNQDSYCISASYISEML